MFLTVQNDGPRILASNFWGLPAARAGKLMVSINAGAFRVLLPEALEPALVDMRTARECCVSRGPWPAQGLADALEVLFDDGTADPFALHLAPQSFDRLPADDDIAKEWTLSVWTRPRRGRDGPYEALALPCGYRRVPRIPWLRPRGGEAGGLRIVPSS